MGEFLASFIVEGGDLQKVIFVPGEVELDHFQAWLALLLLGRGDALKTVPISKEKNYLV
jgi:hypothetical protein